MKEKKYTPDGYLVVSEMDTCSLWEKDTIPCKSGCNNRCFFCRFGEFRTPEYIRYAEEMPRGDHCIVFVVTRKTENPPRILN